MRNYGQIMVGFWTHPRIRKYSDAGKILATYLLTCKHGNSLGAFQLEPGYVATDLGWTEKKVDAAFMELEENGFALFDREINWIVIPDFLQYNKISGPKNASFTLKLFEDVPKKFIHYKKLIEGIQKYGFFNAKDENKVVQKHLFDDGYPIDTLSIPDDKGMDGRSDAETDAESTMDSRSGENFNVGSGIDTNEQKQEQERREEEEKDPPHPADGVSGFSLALPLPDKLAKKDGNYVYPLLFENFWVTNDQGSKKEAYGNWRKIILAMSNGVGPQAAAYKLMDGYAAYVKYCRVNDRSIQDASTFLGPKKETWRQWIGKTVVDVPDRGRDGKLPLEGDNPYEGL